MRKLAIITAFLLSLPNTGYAADNWIHNWINDTMANYSGPSYYDSGKRGYVSFGSFSLRQPQSADQLAAFQVPSVRIGCGGVDLFGGGFHFMDFDYLTQQFQNIISAAPAFAFEYALRAISEQSGTIMDNLKAIADVLNQTQYNSCAMSRQLGYWMASFGDGAYRSIGHKLRDAIPRMEFLSDEDNLFYKTLKDLHDLANGTPDSSTAGNLNKDCPSDFMEILNKGSLVRYIHDTYYPGTDADSLEELIRGYVGDVIFEKKDNFWKAHFLPPCTGQNVESFIAFVQGTALGRPLPSWNLTGDLPAMTCQAVLSSPIINQVDTALNNAYTSLQNNTSLSDTDIQWLQIMPLPILRYLKQLYIYQAPQSAVKAISEPAAYGVGYSMLSLIYADTAKSIQFILDKRVKACSTKTKDSDVCYLCEQDKTVIESLKAFQESLEKRQEEAWRKWQDVQGDIARAQKIITVLKDASQAAVRAHLATGNGVF